MQDAIRFWWLYLLLGVAAAAMGCYGLYHLGLGSSLDWILVAMGLVAVYRGVRGYLLKRSGSADSK